MRNVSAQGIEVLINGGNLDATLPTARAEEVMSARIVNHTTVDGQMIIVEARIHRTFCRSYPYTILVLAQHGTATATKTQADDNRLGLTITDLASGATTRKRAKPSLFT